MTNDIIIDLGSIKVPTSWNEVTLKKFQDIERYYSEKSDESFNVLDVIDIMIDKDKDYVMSLPSDFVGIILERLAFLQQSPVIGEPTNKLTIDGEAYQVNVQNQLKTGEYIQTQTLLKSDPHNYAALMAVICRKPGEEYTTQYEAEVLEDRIKMFENVPVVEVLRVVHFFIEWYAISEIPTQLSLQIKEEINHIRKHIETSRKNGLIGRLSTRSVMKKLNKLEKTINSI